MFCKHFCVLFSSVSTTNTTNIVSFFATTNFA